jgi:hypothetical protein
VCGKRGVGWLSDCELVTLFCHARGAFHLGFIPPPHIRNPSAIINHHHPFDKDKI